MSFRAQREIFRLQHVKKIKFLPAVEMTDAFRATFYEPIIHGLADFFEDILVTRRKPITEQVKDVRVDLV